MTLFHALGAIGASGLSKGSLQFITSATGSAAASISINSCFSASYSHYLVMRNVSMSSGAAANANVRLRASGTDESGANYRLQRIDAAATSVTGLRQTANTSFSAGMGFGEATSFGFARMWISNPFEAVRTTAWTDISLDAGGSIELMSYVHEHDLASSYDGLSVIPSAGTITGSVFVYGLVV